MVLPPLSHFLSHSLVVVLLSVCVVSPAKAGKNPCHNNAKLPSENCTTVTLPPGLCHICGMDAPISLQGDYLDCQRTVRLEDSSGNVNQPCLDLLRQYVDMNPCDEHRSAAYDQYTAAVQKLQDNKEDARQILDYFIYAVCENSCDCVPQVGLTDASEPYADFNRGNCVAHTYYDICKIFPNIALLRGPKDPVLTAESAALPAICPYVIDWRYNSGDGDNFRHVVYTTVAPQVKTFFEHMVNASELVSSDHRLLWDQCLYLEVTQKRINGSLTVPFPPTSAPTSTPSCEDQCLKWLFFLPRKRYSVHVIQNSGRCRQRCVLQEKADALMQEEGYNCGKCPGRWW